MIEISDKEFALFQKLILTLLGINLTEAKRTLVVSRLYNRIRDLNLNSFTDYLYFLRDGEKGKDELVQLINRITTNETSFLRENNHFDYLMSVVFPYFINQQKCHELRIWSSACSSGEEPYTIAMYALNYLKMNPSFNCQIKILGTDISTKVLTKAKSGIYKAEDVSKIPSSFKGDYLQSTKSGDFEFSDKVKKMVSFKRLNLMSERYPLKSPLDIIFCRNVMIYFTEEGKDFVIKNFYNHLKDDGFLFIGHSESLMAQKDIFKPIQNTIYKKIV